MKTKNKLFKGLLTMLILSANLILAQTTITGKVVDSENQEAIPGANIIVVGSNTIKGVPIPTWDILNRCAEEVGFKKSNTFAYKIRNHRFKLLRHSTGKQITIDNVTVLEKI